MENNKSIKSKESRLEFMKKSIAEQIADLKEKRNDKRNYKINEIGKQRKIIKERGESDGNS